MHHTSNRFWLGRIAAALCVAALAGCAAGPAANTAQSTARHHAMVANGEARIDVIVEGRGPAIVLLPSSLRGSEDFDDVAARIAAAGFTVLRPQPRGMGGSTGPLQNLTLNILAGDVAATVQSLGQGRAVLVGHAYGHFVARVADLDHPALVRGVVVAAASARNQPPAPAQSLAIASDPTQPREARLAGLRHAFFAPGHDATPWLEGWHPALRQPYRNASSVPDKSQWWPVSHAPILDLQAADDPWRPASTRDELKQALGDKVTVQVIPGASHALFPEQPAAVADAIVTWTRGLPP